ncbi:MAG: hypothetical protein JXN61_01635 [Sedimentisphaerales bacterium]|nr:hypothetical protein [Sedimentisphaerales bacterium]
MDTEDQNRNDTLDTTRHSRLGIASCILLLAALVIWVGTTVLIAANPGICGTEGNRPTTLGILLAYLRCDSMLLCVIGLYVAGRGICQKAHKRILATIGLVLNVLLVVAVIIVSGPLTSRHIFGVGLGLLLTIFGAANVLKHEGNRSANVVVGLLLLLCGVWLIINNYP